MDQGIWYTILLLLLKIQTQAEKRKRFESQKRTRKKIVWSLKSLKIQREMLRIGIQIICKCRTRTQVLIRIVTFLAEAVESDSRKLPIDLAVVRLSSKRMLDHFKNITKEHKNPKKHNVIEFSKFTKNNLKIKSKMLMM